MTLRFLYLGHEVSKKRMANKKDPSQFEMVEEMSITLLDKESKKPLTLKRLAGKGETFPPVPQGEMLCDVDVMFTPKRGQFQDEIAFVGFNILNKNGKSFPAGAPTPRSSPIPA